MITLAFLNAANYGVVNVTFGVGDPQWVRQGYTIGAIEVRFLVPRANRNFVMLIHSYLCWAYSYRISRMELYMRILSQFAMSLIVLDTITAR